MEGTPGTGPLLLVVDDDARARELMRLILGHAGYRVALAQDSQSAVALLEVERPSAVLADQVMPGLSGIDLCRWVRTRPGMEGLRFILLTGMDDDATVEMARAAGADAVITKPLQRTQLLAQLGGLLAANRSGS